MQHLGALAQRLAESTDQASAAERLAEHALERAPGGAARVYLVGAGDRCATCLKAKVCASREQCFHLVASLGEFALEIGQAQRLPLAESPWAEAARAGKPTFSSAPRELAAPPEQGGEGAALLVPLEAGGESMGLLALRAQGPLSPEAPAQLATAGFLSAATMRSLRSGQAEQRRFEQLLLVNELGRKVNSILNADLLLKQATLDVQRTFGFHNVTIFMLDEGRKHLEFKAHAGRWNAPSQDRPRLALGEGVMGRAFRSGRCEVVQDVRRDADFVSWFADTRSEIAVPIQVGGVVEGVLNVESDRAAAFGPSERLVLETVANQVAIALENARLFGMVREREDRYRTLVESSPAVVLHLDAAGRITYANRALREVTGYDAAQLAERAPTFAQFAVEGDREQVAAALQAAGHGTPVRDLEFQVPHADGSVRLLSAGLQPLVGEHGEARGLMVLARDRTRERELQTKLTQSEKLGAIGSLVSGVAHELNNPLAGILGFAQLLLGRPPETWARGDIEKIERNARRCQRIVENLLTFARQSRMTKRRANLNEVIDSVVALNEYQFAMDNVKVERDLDPRAPGLPVDVNRWQQVFVNLAGNAHQALVAARSKERVIRFQTRVRGRELVIRVSDTGPGVPEHLRTRIFEPFFTTKENGTGLGLGICFGIVRDHGGSIELESGHETGAHFRIVVPLAEGVEVEPPSPRIVPLSTAGTGRRVLIVDDDSSVCDVVVRTLENHGYAVDVASDGRDALDRARRDVYDVLLSDVRMPGDLDGLGLYDALRADAPSVAERLVFMTGNLMDDPTMGRLETLKVRCIEKPFDIHHLAAVVGEVAQACGTPSGTVRA